MGDGCMAFGDMRLPPPMFVLRGGCNGRWLGGFQGAVGPWGACRASVALAHCDQVGTWGLVRGLARAFRSWWEHRGLVRGLARAFHSWLEEEVMGVTVSAGCEPLGWAVLLGWSLERPEDVIFFFF